ncbi:hypothetical protein GCM10022224_008240 [Nonomuraea antimicrobica]|uniref:Ricin B lectin domain-containing protein n=1 Tax=Nonomuraea antimicrobica TaxID=561173 RepID=A0ABP7B3B2_9ACTN
MPGLRSLVVKAATVAVAAAATMSALTAPSSAVDFGTHGYQLKNQQTGKCLRPLNSSTGYASIVQATCTKLMTDQQWVFEEIQPESEPSRYRLKNRWSGLCMAVVEASGAAGARIVQSTCSTSFNANQTWTIESYHFINQNSRLCIQVSAGGEENSVAVQQPVSWDQRLQKLSFLDVGY